MKIVLIGSPILRKKAQPIRKVTSELVHLAESMEDLMKPIGVGLAAPQIGLVQAFFIYDIGEGFHLVVNPQILERKGSATDEEGCLSIPGVYAPIDRPTEITLSYLDHTGRRRIHKYIILRLVSFNMSSITSRVCCSSIGSLTRPQFLCKKEVLSAQH